MVIEPSMTVQFFNLSIFPACIISEKWHFWGQSPLHGTHSPSTVFLFDGQILTQAPLSFKRCFGQSRTQVAP